MAENTSQNHVHSKRCVFGMDQDEMPSFSNPPLCRQFSLDEILLATQNFDEALVVGKGGFGKVYKASINLENGETYIVAIKRLDSDSNQGAPEFWAEIEMLTKLRHCNLVSLIGYCNDNSEMILIYDFMPNGTLDSHLHRDGTTLSWVQRIKISISATRGLHYLHTGTGTQHGIIHRDVKSSNILLDKDYAAKISDFGLSKIGPTKTSSAYVKTHVRGTFGYLDPDYFLTGRLTRKTDVFAFGVVLFELLCGRVALDTSLDDDECSLAKWAHKSIEEGKVYEIVDFNIKSQISPKCLKVFAQIADRCLSSNSKKRPTMAEILVDLERSLTLQNKFDSHIKPAAGIFARMFKWTSITPEVNSAQSDRKSSTINEDIIEHHHLSKEDNDDHHDVVLSGEKLDRWNHVSAPTKSYDTNDINQVYLSKDLSDGEHEVPSARKIQILAHHLKKFSFDDLKKATSDFEHAMRLGGGEFGDVFEGEGWIKSGKVSGSEFGKKMYTSSGHAVDYNSIRIAVKRFHHDEIQHFLRDNGDIKFVDLTVISKLNHPSLTKLLGYCFEDETLFLIYEFTESGSLDSHLFSSSAGARELSGPPPPLGYGINVTCASFSEYEIPLVWKTRIQIARQVAEALSLLHRTNNQVLNFSIRIHQILLDENFNASIINPLHYQPQQSNISKFEGTVCSFGVLLIQMITGEPISEIGIANLRQNMWDPNGEHRKESLRRALDPCLHNADADSTIMEAMKLALDCVANPYFTLMSALGILRQIETYIIKRDARK